MSDLLKNLSTYVEKAGEHIDDIANTFSKGVLETVKEGVNFIDDLAFGNSGKTFDLIQLLSVRQSLVKALYPIDVIEKALEETPNDAKLLLDLYEMKERQFDFSMKLLRVLNLTPFSAQMSQKTSEVIELDRNQGVLKKSRELELNSIREEIALKMDKAIAENDMNTVKLFIRDFLRVKILTKDFENFDTWLSLSRELETEFDRLFGKYYLVNDDCIKALPFLEKAYFKKEQFAEEDLQECIEKLIKKNPNNLELKNKRKKYFPYLTGNEFKERLKSLPINFLLVKKKQIDQILGAKNE